MGRPKKIPTEEYTHELVAAERERLLKGFESVTKGAEISDAAITAEFRKKRPFILAELLAISRFDPDPAQRKWALSELLKQDIGKAMKRAESDDVGVIVMAPGKYGIQANFLELGSEASSDRGNSISQV